MLRQPRRKGTFVSAPPHQDKRAEPEPELTVDQLLTDLSGDGSHHVLRSEVALRTEKGSSELQLGTTNPTFQGETFKRNSLSPLCLLWVRRNPEIRKNR